MQKTQFFPLSWKTVGAVILLPAFLALYGLSALAASASTSYEGIIEPSEVVEVGSPVTGIVARVLVERGSSIEEGQPLVELDSSLEHAALNEVNARAQFSGAIEEQRAQLAFAQRSHRRMRSLSAIPVLEKDRAETQAILARHRLKKALEARTQAENEQKKAEIELARRTIKSPLTGLVLARYVSPGEYVATQPLLRIAKMDPLRVEVIVPATIFGQIHVGQRATIVPELAAFGRLQGTVILADQFIDAASNTFGLRLELPNPDKKIPSGLKCQVYFPGEEIPEPKETPPQTLQ